ncbi:MAG: hypothetical protein U0524_00520 [Candidatus Saccharimonadales bacterium]
MVPIERPPEQSNEEVEAAIAAENNPEIYPEAQARRTIIDKIKHFAGGVATALGQAERGRPLDF